MKTIAILGLLLSAPLFACAVAPVGDPTDESEVRKCTGSECDDESSSTKETASATETTTAPPPPAVVAPAAPATCADTAEPNNTALAATVMGELRVESPKTLKGSVNAGDEDWFQISAMEDGDYFGSRGIDLRVSAPAGTKNPGVEVAIFYACNESKIESKCGSGTPDDATKDLKGCKAEGDVHLEVTCGSLFDSQRGTAFIRVRKVGADATCAPYTLDVKVED